jgi:hypothetical protein
VRERGERRERNRVERAGEARRNSKDNPANEPLLPPSLSAHSFYRYTPTHSNTHPKLSSSRNRGFPLVSQPFSVDAGFGRKVFCCLCTPEAQQTTCHSLSPNTSAFLVDVRNDSATKGEKEGQGKDRHRRRGLARRRRGRKLRKERRTGRERASCTSPSPSCTCE